MEKFNKSKNYRDNLANDLRKARKEDPVKAQKILEQERQSIRYQESESIHDAEHRKLIQEQFQIRKEILTLEQQKQEIENKKQTLFEKIKGVFDKKKESEQLQLNERMDYLAENFYPKWNFSIKMSPVIQKPSDFDWSGLWQKSREKSMTRGFFTLNPETINLNYENFTPEIINKPEWLGKKRTDVIEEVIAEYSETHHIVGYDFVEWLHKYPKSYKYDDILDTKNYLMTPGTVVGSDNGAAFIPCVIKDRNNWRMHGLMADDRWDITCRILLLRRNKEEEKPIKSV